MTSLATAPAPDPAAAAAAAPLVVVRGLTRHYGPVRAVDGIDFTIAPGEVVGLLGGNGAGKTTTISMLLGLLLPTAGTISILGHDMLKDRQAVLHQMNFSSPYVDLPARLTVRQNLTVYSGLYSVRPAAPRIAELADELALSPFMDRPCGRLSAGQKTRVALAKALLNRPQLLLLDEPTASLDPDTADWVRGYLAAYQRRTGASILLASHNMGEVERMCHEVLMMQAGRIVDRGTPSALIARYGRANMEEVFLHIAREGALAEALP